MGRGQIIVSLVAVVLASCHPSSTPVDVPTLQSFRKSLEANPESYPWDYSVGLKDIDPPLVETGETLGIVVKTEIQESPNKNCRFTATYPSIEGLKDTALQAELNQSLKQEILEEPDRLFQRTLTQEHCTTDPKSEHIWHINMHECTTKFARRSLVSITCDEPMFGMGPYPNIWDVTVTFDLATGKIYRFSDLFKPNSNYAQRISRLMLDDYVEYRGDTQGFDGKSLAERGVDETFYLASQCENRETISIGKAILYLTDSTCIIFPNMFSSGPSRNMTSEVSVDEIKDILNFDGALQALQD